MQHPDAAIVTGRVKPRVTKRGHYLDLILRHGAERIVRMVGAARQLLGIAIAAQIRRHHREFFGKPRRKFVPGQMAERIAVQQQERRSLAAVHRHDARAAGCDLGAGEVFEHFLSQSFQ